MGRAWWQDQQCWGSVGRKVREQLYSQRQAWRSVLGHWNFFTRQVKERSNLHLSSHLLSLRLHFCLPQGNYCFLAVSNSQCFLPSLHYLIYVSCLQWTIIVQDASSPSGKSQAEELVDLDRCQLSMTIWKYREGASPLKYKACKRTAAPAKPQDYNQKLVKQPSGASSLTDNDC